MENVRTPSTPVIFVVDYPLAILFCSFNLSTSLFPRDRGENEKRENWAFCFLFRPQ